MKILTRCGRGWIDTKENNMGTAAVKFKSAICWGTYYEVAAVARKTPEDFPGMEFKGVQCQGCGSMILIG